MLDFISAVNALEPARRVSAGPPAAARPGAGAAPAAAIRFPASAPAAG
jgi:hypothetical protein